MVTYLGIDETTLGTQNSSLIVVCAQTDSQELLEDKGWNALKKAKDLLREAKAYTSGDEIEDYEKIPKLPSLDEMPGLVDFRWMRTSIGHNSRQLIEHASIAHIIAQGEYKPEDIVLYVDAFHGNEALSVHLIRKFLDEYEIMVPVHNIQIVPSGDKRIPLINYADMLAFQIGLSMNEMYSRYHDSALKIPLKSREIDFDERRIKRPLSGEQKQKLEGLVAEYRRKGKRA
jgi:hypothetical protein